MKENDEMKECVERYAKYYFQFRGYVAELTDYPDKTSPAKWEGLKSFQEVFDMVWFYFKMLRYEVAHMDTLAIKNPSEEYRLTYNNYLNHLYFSVTGLLIKSIRESKGYPEE